MSGNNVFDRDARGRDACGRGVDGARGPEPAGLLADASAELGLPESGWSVVPIQPDGSDRGFFRIRRGRSSYIALISPRRNGSEVDENDSYFRIGRHLHRRSVPVPRIVFADPGRGRFLMQDLGDYHLQRHALRRGMDLPKLYRRAICLLARMHERARPGFSSSYCFDTALYDSRFAYERELEYFRNAFLVGYVGLDVADEDLRPDFENLADSAGASADCSTVLHRDFQSRNIMVHRGGLWVLDFQGMRFGPCAYDLASLLLDPYVMLPERLQESLAELYWTGARRLFGGSHAAFSRSYHAVRLCRNLQVLGAYGFLGIVKGKKQFLRYIPGAWKQLRRWVHGPCRGLYPRLEKWIVLAQRKRSML